MSDKFCKDCKHFRWSGRCMSPEIGVDPLFGEPRGLHASVLREPGRACGLRANWFNLTLTNEAGCDFEIADFTINAVPTQRRI